MNNNLIQGTVMVKLMAMATSPFACLGIIENNPDVNSFIQYGALGLCTVMVGFMIKHITDLTIKLDAKNAQIIEMLQKDIDAKNRLSQCLEDRPCITHASGVK